MSLFSSLSWVRRFTAEEQLPGRIVPYTKFVKQAFEIEEAGPLSVACADYCEFLQRTLTRAGHCLSSAAGASAFSLPITDLHQLVDAGEKVIQAFRAFQAALDRMRSKSYATAFLLAKCGAIDVKPGPFGDIADMIAYHVIVSSECQLWPPHEVKAPQIVQPCGWITPRLSLGTFYELHSFFQTRLLDIKSLADFPPHLEGKKKRLELAVYGVHAKSEYQPDSSGAGFHTIWFAMTSGLLLDFELEALIDNRRHLALLRFYPRIRDEALRGMVVALPAGVVACEETRRGFGLKCAVVKPHHKEWREITDFDTTHSVLCERTMREECEFRIREEFGDYFDGDVRDDPPRVAFVHRGRRIVSEAATPQAWCEALILRACGVPLDGPGDCSSS
jgi:hypothetical protein